MKLRMWGRIALAAAFAAGGIGTASANEPIERSGNVFHQAVCGRAIGRGEARCFAHVRVDARGNPTPGKPDGVSPNVVPSGYGPNDLKSAYNSTATGSLSRVVAIVDAYGYANAEADLNTYRAQYGLAPCTTANGCFVKLDQRGGTAYPRANTGWAQEQALDLDMASAMCSGCKIMLVQADSATLANLAAAVNTAASRGANVISNSYGGGEAGTTSYETAYRHPGVAVTVSTGDSGYGVQFPASSPNVIAVGGTHLTRASNGRGWAETAWSSGGSGCSSVYAKPAGQSDPLCATRMEADISAVGDPATGVAVYGPNGRGSASSWLVFGGTSVSAPLIGGMYGASGVNPTASQHIYTAAATSFNDVTAGTNGSCGGTYFCTAGAGYDGPTGRGTPNGSSGL
jgi:hypothetical protein